MSDNNDNSMFDCIRWLSIPNCVDYFDLGDYFLDFDPIKFNDILRKYKSYDWKPDNVLSSIIKLHDIIYTWHSDDIRNAIGVFPPKIFSQDQSSLRKRGFGIMIMSILHSIGFDYHDIANNLHYKSIASSMIYTHLQDNNKLCYPTLDSIKMFATLEITKSYYYSTINDIITKRSIENIPTDMNAMQAWIHYNNFTDDTALTDGWLDWMIWQHNVNKTMYFEGRYGILTEDDKLKIANLIKDGMPSEIIIESVRLLHEPIDVIYDYVGAPLA